MTASGRSRAKMATSIRAITYGPLGNYRTKPGTNVNPRQAVAHSAARGVGNVRVRVEWLAHWGLDAA